MAAMDYDDYLSGPVTQTAETQVDVTVPGATVAYEPMPYEPVHFAWSREADTLPQGQEQGSEHSVSGVVWAVLGFSVAFVLVVLTGGVPIVIGLLVGLAIYAHRRRQMSSFRKLPRSARR
jgi:hypothetical protein